MDTKVFFYDTLKDLASKKPYLILTVAEVTAVTDKFESLVKLINTNPETKSECKKLHANLEAGVGWCIAIDNAMKDQFFPHVVLSAEKYEQSMSLVQLIDEMMADH